LLANDELQPESSESNALPLDHCRYCWLLRMYTSRPALIEL